MESRRTLGDRSVLMVLVFSFITFGIYYAFWFLNRRDTLNNLSAPTKLDSSMPQILLALLIISLFGEFADVFIADRDILRFVMLSVSTLNLVCAILGWILAFRVKRILEEQYREKLSGLATFFFTIYYLQYKMNRFPLPTDTLNTTYDSSEFQTSESI